MKNDEPPLVSVVIVAWNRCEDVRESLLRISDTGMLFPYVGEVFQVGG